MIYGVDVSNWQGAYPWNSGEAFGLAKATEGTFYKDPSFPRNWSDMWAKHILRGAYHFGHPGTSAAEQAAYFVAYVKQHGLEKLDVLMLDLEVSDGKTAAEVAAWAVEFVNDVEHATGKNVWVYADGSFIAGGYCNGLYANPLVIANPNGTPGQVTVPIEPFKVWTVQQYAFGTGGQPDKDVLNGDAAVWAALANLLPPTPPKPTYKYVTASWTCEGQESLTELCAGGFGPAGTPAVLASTVIRLTLDNSHDQVFAANLAAYINAGDLAHTPVPKGVVLYYPKRVKVS